VLLRRDTDQDRHSSKFPPPNSDSSKVRRWTAAIRLKSLGFAVMREQVCCDCGRDFTASKTRLWCDDCSKTREPWRKLEPPPADTLWARPNQRLCKSCGRPTITSRHWYCWECGARARAKRRVSSKPRARQPTRQQRGYDAGHDRARRRWEPLVKAGMVSCGRCGRPIPPNSPWDLSHPGDNKAIPPVPWHAKCNRSYAASVTKKRRRGSKGPGTREESSRPW
jgi:hypothetical protein